MEAKRRLDAETWKLGKGIVVVPNVDGYLLKASVAEIYRQGGMKQIPYMAGCVTNDLGTKPEELKKNDPGDILKECRDFSIRCSEVTGYPSYVYHFGRKLPGDDWGLSIRRNYGMCLARWGNAGVRWKKRIMRSAVK